MPAVSQPQSTRTHPRRRPLLKTSLPSLVLAAECTPSISKMHLKKGETFHTPTSPPSKEQDPVLEIRSLPHRSPTSLESIDISEQRMTSILDRLTLDSSDDESDTSTSTQDDVSVRRSIQGVDLEDKLSRRRPSLKGDKTLVGCDRDNDHDSDSGLGSSVGSCEFPSSNIRVNNGVNAVLDTATAPIGRSEMGFTHRRQLSFATCKLIERHLLLPLLKEPKLKPFNRLVESIPSRVVNKKIVCLRDFERVLLWLSPRYAPSRLAYLKFAEFTIQCLHTSVPYLNDRDLRLPTDRPYSNGYFLDLVSQVRRAAAMVQESRGRAQEAQGSDADAEDNCNLQSKTSVSLEGGLSVTGHDAELVITQDGKQISMRTGLTFEPQTPTKRAITPDETEEAADEGVQRSMARRKKNAPPMDINQKCSHCDKVFKRPCDLTKHEKTHSRPWKCTEPTCKYHEIGWPTEKERDRHLNDKHAASPALFTCEFSPCPYASKRQSNCKQHMEKAHGWVYVRSKNNARNSTKSGSPQQATPDTPTVSTPASAASGATAATPADFSTPVTGPSPSPHETPSLPGNGAFNFADPPQPAHQPAHSEDYSSLFDPSSYPTSTAGVDSEYALATSLNLDAYQAQFEAADPNSLIPALEMHRQSMNSMSVPSAESVPDLVGQTMSFDGSPLAATDSSMNFDAEWSQLGMPVQDEFSYHMQLATPNHSVTNPLTGYSNDMGPNQYPYDTMGKISGLSPGAQGQLTLYSPVSGAADEHLSDHYEYGVQAQDQNDFTLYGTTSGFNAAHSVPPVNRYDAVNEYAQSQVQTMFPPLPDWEFQNAQSWPEQRPQGFPSDGYAGQDMDMQYE